MRRPPRLRAMAKETSPSDSSLPLHEVLEAEFVTLYGQLPANYPSSSEPETRLKGLWAAVHAQRGNDVESSRRFRLERGLVPRSECTNSKCSLHILVAG